MGFHFPPTTAIVVSTPQMSRVALLSRPIEPVSFPWLVLSHHTIISVSIAQNCAYLYAEQEVVYFNDERGSERSLRHRGERVLSGRWFLLILVPKDKAELCSSFGEPSSSCSCV